MRKVLNKKLDLIAMLVKTRKTQITTQIPKQSYYIQLCLELLIHHTQITKHDNKHLYIRNINNIANAYFQAFDKFLI